MWPDLWVTLAALIAAVAAVPIARWLVQRASRIWEEAESTRPGTPEPAVKTAAAAAPVAPLPPAALPLARSPAVGRRGRWLSARAARGGVVLAAILGPCRALSDDDGRG